MKKERREKEVKWTVSLADMSFIWKKFSNPHTAPLKREDHNHIGYVKNQNIPPNSSIPIQGWSLKTVLGVRMED